MNVTGPTVREGADSAGVTGALPHGRACDRIRVTRGLRSGSMAIPSQTACPSCGKMPRMTTDAKPRVYDILAKAFTQEGVRTCFALLGDAIASNKAPAASKHPVAKKPGHKRP